ncbi:MAG: prolipoprotein diacylglyceryl transferase [Gemmatimonadota bacterium]
MPPLTFAEIVFPGFDPVALHLGPLQVRWYGLGYLAGFIIAGWVLDRLCRDGFLPFAKSAVSDLIGWLVVGVVVGGRLGYALFYEPRMLLHPLEILWIWTGGLSFHGGLAGVVVASALFARKHRIPWRRLVDGLSLAAPFGIFLVRCANFVNAELYGRVAPAWLPWAMRFPTDPAAARLSPELAAGGAFRWHDAYTNLRMSGVWEQIAAQVPLRHPSQLYEALLEGALLAALLWHLYHYHVRPHLRVANGGAPGARSAAAARLGRPGALAGLFLLGYAAARFAVEFTRQPDIQFSGPGDPLGTVLGPLSMGQLLSLGVAVFGAAMMWWSPRGARDGGGAKPRL